MEKQDFRDFLDRHKWSRDRFAELFDIRSRTTVQNWTEDETPINIPGWVEATCEYIDASPEFKAWLEARRPAGPVRIRRKSGVRKRSAKRTSAHA